MRIAVLLDNISPHHVAQLNAAAGMAKILAVQVSTVSAGSDVFASTLSSNSNLFETRTLFPDRRSETVSVYEYRAAIAGKVGSWHPDVIALPEWSEPMSLAGVHWADALDIPAIVMSDCSNFDKPKRRLIEFIKSNVVKYFSAGLCSGENAKNYLVQLGMPPETISLGYHVVDNKYFDKQCGLVRSRAKMPAGENGVLLNPLRQRRYILASSKFSPKSNLVRLMYAYAAYRKQAANVSEAWPLVILGNGEMRPTLQKLRHELDLDGVVQMPGSKQYEELPEYYGTAGAFIHASTTRQWGLVVNEAMASSLPVLVSNHCGCASNLVDEGKNGFLFDPENIEEITSALDTLTHLESLPEMGLASRALIKDWGTERFAGGLLTAANIALNSAIPKPRLHDRVALNAISTWQVRQI